MTQSSDFIIVAIDGGAAAGKSSTARALSERFQLMHADTGSYYRFLTHELLARGVSADDPEPVSRALEHLPLATRVEGRNARMEIAGRTPGPELRSEAVNTNVSKFAALPAVRNFLLDYQRGQAAVARSHGFAGLVMEGRDIGSVIFPDATFRFFLKADPAERERRRAREGHQDQIRERDRIDSSRKASPLTFREGAIEIDSTFLTLDQVVAQMSSVIEGGATRKPGA
jgi:cytidylate kinase